MAKRNKTNNDIDVTDASKLSFGENHITDTIGNDIGSSYGSKKVTAFGNYVIYLAIVILSSNALKITGWRFNQKKNLTTPNTNILFTMGPIFTKMVA